MKKKIIALRGAGGRGKTSSIGLLHELLVQRFGGPLVTNFRKAGANCDFWSVFIVNGVAIGITSKGDTYDYVKGDLDLLINRGCIILVCACRTSDRTNKHGEKRGSNLAIDEYTDHQAIRINKTVSANRQDQQQNDQNNIQDSERMLEELLRQLEE